MKLFYTFIILMLSSTCSFAQVNFYTPYNYNPGKNTTNYSNNSQQHVLIILDSSNSMSEEINGVEKMQMAKDAIKQVLSKTKGNLKIGLRVYGHKDGFLGIGACKASELKVPISSNSKNAIANELKYINPVGWTPICYSLEQAIKSDFAGISGKKRIILVSDGMETCYGNPCDYAIELVKNNSDVIIDVIGFDLDDPAALSQLKCTALATKGRFYDVKTAAELVKSIQNSIDATKEVQGVIVK